LSPFLSFLESVANDPARECEWVDLLSQLEYVGCRKIIKAVPFERVDLSLLQHVAEEASHAFLLKKAAGPYFAGRSWPEGRFSALGWKYFQTLDRAVSEAIVDKNECYPVVSWAVERRVMEVYPAYLKITKNPAVKEALSIIVEQEKRHGKQFDGWNIPLDQKEKIIALERGLWQELVDGLLGAPA